MRAQPAASFKAPGTRGRGPGPVQPQSSWTGYQSSTGSSWTGAGLGPGLSELFRRWHLPSNCAACSERAALHHPPHVCQPAASQCRPIRLDRIAPLYQILASAPLCPLLIYALRAKVSRTRSRLGSASDSYAIPCFPWLLLLQLLRALQAPPGHLWRGVHQRHGAVLYGLPPGGWGWGGTPADFWYCLAAPAAPRGRRVGGFRVGMSALKAQGAAAQWQSTCMRARTPSDRGPDCPVGSSSSQAAAATVAASNP